MIVALIQSSFKPTKVVGIDLFFLLHSQLWRLINACLDNEGNMYQVCKDIWINWHYTSEDNVLYRWKSYKSAIFSRKQLLSDICDTFVTRRLTLALLAFTGCSTNLRHFALKHIQHCARVCFILLRLSVFPRFGRKTWDFGESSHDTWNSASWLNTVALATRSGCVQVTAIWLRFSHHSSAPILNARLLIGH